MAGGGTNRPTISKLTPPDPKLKSDNPMEQVPGDLMET